MTYFDDLSTYKFLGGRPEALNVGWLDSSHVFKTGDAGRDALQTLHRLAVTQFVNQTRGFHVCELCEAPVPKPIGAWGGKSRVLGSAEIWLSAANGVQYACPDLIIHYIEAHNYLPPDEFLRALQLYPSGYEIAT